jgi:hypothetical protein
MRVAVLVALVAALAVPPVAPAADKQKPSARELWQTYPLHPSPTAAGSAAQPSATGAPRRPARAPARHHSSSASWLPLAVLAVACAAAIGLWRRRRTRAPAPAPVQAAPAARRFAAAPLWGSRRAEAAAARPAAVPEWPWPDDLAGRWRCEIGLAPAALSSQVQAVAHDPAGEPRTVLTASPAGPGGPDWQSSDALDEAIAALAGELEAHGWEPVAGGRPHTRRLYWPHEGDPFARAQEAAWTA